MDKPLAEDVFQMLKKLEPFKTVMSFSDEQNFLSKAKKALKSAGVEEWKLKGAVEAIKRKHAGRVVHYVNARDIALELLRQGDIVESNEKGQVAMNRLEKIASKLAAGELEVVNKIEGFMSRLLAMQNEAIALAKEAMDTTPEIQAPGAADYRKFAEVWDAMNRMAIDVRKAGRATGEQPRADFDKMLNEFIEQLNVKIEKYYRENYTHVEPEMVVASYGRRFVRLERVQKGGTGRSAFGFVDRMTGDLLKAASFNAPAKHARGNLFDRSSWASAAGPYGMAYLR